MLAVVLAIMRHDPRQPYLLDLELLLALDVATCARLSALDLGRGASIGHLDVGHGVCGM